MKIILKTLSFCLLLLCSFSVHAQEENNGPDYDITDVKYSGNLEILKKINISGKNLDECSKILVNGEFLEQGVSSFLFRENQYSGNVSVLCDNRKIQYSYRFPKISSLDFEKESNHVFVEIEGENFDKDSKVYFGGAKFVVDYVTDNKILGKLSGEFKNSDFYVESNSLKSPIFITDFPLPKITKVQSSTGFLAGSQIKIYGDNLTDYHLYFAGEKYLDVKKQDDYFLFELPKRLGKHDIYFENNGITSNKISIDIQNKKVLLEKYLEKTDGDSETGKVLELIGKNFPYYDDDIEVFINGKKQDIKNVGKNSLYIDNFEFEDGLNEIYTITNGVYSNSLFFFQEVRLPYVSSITDTEFSETQRILTLGIVGLDKNKDKILVDGKNIKVLGCYSNTCRIGLKKSHVIGEISVERNGLVHENVYSFDFTQGAQPYIEKIRFDETPKGLTKFTIYGRNFLGSNISGRNIFQKNDNKLDIDVDNESIKGRLPRDFSGGKLSIKVEKYGLISDFSFSIDEIQNNTIKNAPFITELRPENDMFHSYGDTLKIRGYGFNKGDILYIGNTQYPLDFSEGYTYPQVVLDKKLSTDFYEAYILNSAGKKSNTLEMFISDNSSPEFSIIGENNTQKFLENSQSNKPIFSAKFKNGITDVTLSQMIFKIHGENIQGFGSLDLYVGGKYIETQVVDEEGKIYFSYPVTFDAPNNDHTISLKKKGYFYNTGKFQVELISNGLTFKDTDLNKFIPNISIQGKTFIVAPRKFYNCYNEKSKNISCSENTQSETNQNIVKPIIPEKNNDIKNTDNNTAGNDKNEINKDQDSMKNKIDTVVEKLYLKIQKRSTHNQLIYFKNLKIKIQRISNTLPRNHKQKDIIEYLHDSIDKKYKIIFKQYVLEMKK